MSNAPLSPISAFLAAPALRDGLVNFVSMTSPDSARYFPADSRAFLVDRYGRDAAVILNDLGGLAAAW